MEPIAIVGMAGRFPGAANLDQFWANLSRGVEGIHFFSDEELAAAGVDAALLRHPRFVRARGVVPGSECFDARFFGMSPREAQLLDPQHRVFLEAAWEALERAGYAPGGAPLNAGVFAGTSQNTYLVENLIGNLEATFSAGPFQMMISNDKDFLATRAAYKLNLKGPALTIQTACSTSLVAVQVACQNLLTGQCDLALAGGVTVLVPRVGGYLYEQGMILSPDGHCRAFDALARGTVPGEGVGVVVLKRLADAQADRNHIHAVIRGAAINNDGSLKVGYTAPSVDGQAAVIAAAQDMGGIHPDTITCIEAHGTGTSLGDPIEIGGLTQAFRRKTQRRGYCAIGSVKTNIGHLDAAAGVAGLIKMALALEHRLIPPSLHFTEPNPAIDFAASPFFVNSAPMAWPADEGQPRRGGVSSFGIGGTNAHVVLEEAPAPAPAPPSRPFQVLTLSAKSEAALDRATAALGAHLAGHPEQDLADVAATLHRGRPAFPFRRALVAEHRGDAVETLAQKEPKRVLSAVASRPDRPVAFLFSGQGSQYVGMGAGLYQSEPVFREYIDAGAGILQPVLGFDLREVLVPGAEARAAAEARLAGTAATQPALFLVEYAAAQLFMAWGVRPRAMLGHSIGEYTAAALSGVLRFEDALRLVAERGRLMEVPGGAMIVVPLAERELRPRLPDGLAIAAANGPALCAVSGPAPAVASFKAQLAGQGIEAQAIHAAAAFHSSMMDPILEPFTRAAGAVRLAAPSIPYVSNVTGTWMTAEDATDPGYWARHIRGTVRFWDGLQHLAREGDPILLELGPGHTLTSLARPLSKPSQPVTAVPSLRHPHDPQPDAAVLQAAVARLWLGGAEVDWSAYHGREARRRVPLPTYPFERERHWLAAGPAPKAAAPVTLAQLPKREDLASWFYVPSWRRTPIGAPSAEGLAAAWLLFADDGEVAPAIRDRLASAGARVVTVTRGSRFSRAGPDRYTLDPERREDYDRLVQELKAGGALPARVLHLWGLAGPDTPPSPQADGFYSLVFLAQALGDQHVRAPVAIGVVTNGLQDVTGEDVYGIERATVLGPSIAIPEEMPQVGCRTIDVVLPATAPERGALVEQLLQELDQPAGPLAVAYRGRHRWAQDWEGIRLEGGGTRPVLRPRGVYLITGGLGGIGLVLAGHLARRAQARLVLAGRTGLPPRDAWAECLRAHAEPDPVSARIRAVQGLEAAGSEVLVLSADTTREEEVSRVVEETERRFGAINGIIHAAGSLELGIVQLKTRETADRVLGPKLLGTPALWARVPHAELDFLFLCSSISTVVGGPGLADYRGANAYLDAFARRHANAGGGPRVVAARFDAWQEVGMAVALGEADNLPKAISPAQGVEVFDRVLGSGLSEVVVSTRDLPRLIALARQAAAGAAAEPAGEPEPAAAAPGAGDAGSFMAPASAVERQVAQIWQTLLGIERIGTGDDFFDLGGHSLLATQVMSRLYQRYDVDVPLRTLFEATTLGAFAERVAAIVEKAGGEREEIEL